MITVEGRVLLRGDTAVEGDESKVLATFATTKHTNYYLIQVTIL